MHRWNISSTFRKDNFERCVLIINCTENAKILLLKEVIKLLIDWGFSSVIFSFILKSSPCVMLCYPSCLCVLLFLWSISFTCSSCALVLPVLLIQFVVLCSFCIFFVVLGFSFTCSLSFSTLVWALLLKLPFCFLNLLSWCFYIFWTRKLARSFVLFLFLFLGG